MADAIRTMVVRGAPAIGVSAAYGLALAAHHSQAKNAAALWQELTQAETAPVREFEKTVFFEGCMPVEAMAARGIDTLRFGPLKPVGLPRPDTGRIP